MNKEEITGESVVFFCDEKGQCIDPIKPRRVSLKERKDTIGLPIVVLSY
jgi:hypothetical protein